MQEVAFGEEDPRTTVNRRDVKRHLDSNHRITGAKPQSIPGLDQIVKGQARISNSESKGKSKKGKLISIQRPDTKQLMIFK